MAENNEENNGQESFVLFFEPVAMRAILPGNPDVIQVDVPGIRFEMDADKTDATTEGGEPRRKDGIP